jgi:DNA-binding PadR family transcriptional regulator
MMRHSKERSERRSGDRVRVGVRVRGERTERRGRLRHGDMRAALLLALAEGPAHGYEIGQRLFRASGGAWQPSPGSIYPTLQMLDDEELVESEEREQKRVYRLTRRGQAFLKARSDEGTDVPWHDATAARAGELRQAVAGLKGAARQVADVGSVEQREQATQIIVEARRRLYELLARG